MPMIRVGAQHGSKDSSRVTDFMHKALTNLFFYRLDLGPYFRDLKFFAITLRVSGNITDFRSEGGENLKRVRGKNYYAMDLVIPEHAWKGVSFEGIRQYFVEGVQECFEMMLAKARKDGELVDEELLRSDFDTGIKKILSASEDDAIFNASYGKAILVKMIEEAKDSGLPVNEQEIQTKISNGEFSMASAIDQPHLSGPV